MLFLTQCLREQELVKRTAAVLVDAANDPNGKAAQQIEVRVALVYVLTSLRSVSPYS